MSITACRPLRLAVVLLVGTDCIATNDTGSDLNTGGKAMRRRLHGLSSITLSANSTCIAFKVGTWSAIQRRDASCR